MKKTFLMLMLALVLAFTARAQVLQNSWWRAYTANDSAVEFWRFGQDTLSFSYDDVTYNNKSVFSINDSLFTITDFDWSPCITYDSGVYIFSIQADTLRLTYIFDGCIYRSLYLMYHYFTRLYAGTENNTPFSSATIYPNPSADGIFNLKFTDYSNLPTRIYVLSADGRKIKEENSTGASTNHSINLQSSASGVYFLVMEGEKGRRVLKLVR